MKDFDCPYCEKPLEVCHDDGNGLREDEKHQMECPHCEKNFVFDTTIIISHDAYKADCLNGEPHQYKETRTVPRIYAQMRCTACDHEIPLTEARLQEILAAEGTHHDPR